MSDVMPEPTTSASGFEKPIFPVLIAGMVTTALTLLGLFLINKATDEWNVMGWYASRIIPIGAMLVGAVAASGYGLVSYYTGIKINKGLLAFVLLFQVIAYGLAQYIEYRDVIQHVEGGHSVGFFAYFDATTRLFAFKPKYGSGTGTPLGEWGYAFRVLEVAGFCAGGVFVPAVLRAVPFCDRCQRYQKTRSLTYIGGSAPTKAALFKNADQKATEAADKEAAWQAALDKVETFGSLASAGNTAAFRDNLAAVRPDSKKAANQAQRIVMELISCPSCADGRLKFSVVTGQGRNMRRTELSSQSVTPEFVRQLLA